MFLACWNSFHGSGRLKTGVTRVPRLEFSRFSEFLLLRNRCRLVACWGLTASYRLHASGLSTLSLLILGFRVCRHFSVRCYASPRMEKCEKSMWFSCRMRNANNWKNSSKEGSLRRVNWESYLAMRLGRFIDQFVDQHKLGIVLGTDGMLRFAPGLIRIPDVSFLSWDHFPE